MPARDWSRDDALVEILRGRLEGLGPVTASALAAPLGLEPRRHRGRARGAAGRRLRDARALHAGRGRGRVVRAPAARAHPPLHGQAPARRDRAGRGARLPALPVRTGSTSPPTRACRGRRRSTAIVAQLEGFEAPAGAWETEILPARVADYEPSWLDELCLAGRIAWTRLRPRNGRGERRRAQRRRRCARRRSRCCRAACPRTGRRSSPTPERGPAERRARRRSPTASASTAPRSSTRSSRAPACCAPRSRRRWPSWSRSAS